MEYSMFSEWLAKTYLGSRHVGGDERMTPQEHHASERRIGRVMYALTAGTLVGRWTLIDVEWNYCLATQGLGQSQPAYLSLPGRQAFAISRTMTEALNSADTSPESALGRVDLGDGRDIRTMILVVDSDGAGPLIRDTITLFEQKTKEMRRLIFIFANEIDVPEWMREQEKELASLGINWFECIGHEAEGDVEFI